MTNTACTAEPPPGLNALERLAWRQRQTQWSCQACNTLNPNTEAVCQACEIGQRDGKSKAPGPEEVPMEEKQGEPPGGEGLFGGPAQVGGPAPTFSFGGAFGGGDSAAPASTAPSSGGFSFNATSTGGSSGGFSFTPSEPSANATSSSTGGFTFNASSSSTSAGTGGFTFSAAPSGDAEKPAASSGGFTFNASSSAGSSGFSFPAAAPSDGDQKAGEGFDPANPFSGKGDSGFQVPTSRPGSAMEAASGFTSPSGDKSGTNPNRHLLTPSIYSISNIGIESPAPGAGKQPPASKAHAIEATSKMLDDHRDLPVGSTIVLTCGYGGFAQLGLGDDDEDEDDREFEANVDDPRTPRKPADPINEDDGGKPWPDPCLIEAEVPTRCPRLDNIQISSVSMGALAGGAVGVDGSVRVWGCNDGHPIGPGGDKWVPEDMKTLFPEGVKITKMTGGQSHTVYLDSEGRVYTCGTFINDGWKGGRWDEKTKTNSKCMETPVHLHEVNTSDDRQALRGKTLPPIVDISSGSDHFLMLDGSGYIWEMGVTTLGQRSSRRNQGRYLQPRLSNLPKSPWKHVRFRAVRCGAHFNLAISTDNDLFAWGQNNYLQCGMPKKTRQANPELIDIPIKIDLKGAKVADAGAGCHMAVALDTDGYLWTWGRNASFELGRRTRVPPKSMIDGQKQHFENEPEPALPAKVNLLKNVTRISIGQQHWYAATADSTVYAVGSNLDFRTGLGTDEGNAEFVPIFHEANLQSDFVVQDMKAGTQNSVFLLKRVARRKKNCLPISKAPRLIRRSRSKVNTPAKKRKFDEIEKPLSGKRPQLKRAASKVKGPKRQKK